MVVDVAPSPPDAKTATPAVSFGLLHDLMYPTYMGVAFNGITAMSQPFSAPRRDPSTVSGGGGGRLCMVKTGVLEQQTDPVSSNHPISQNVHYFWQAPRRSRKADLCFGPGPSPHMSLPEGGVAAVLGNDLPRCPPLPRRQDLRVSGFALEAAGRVQRRADDRGRVQVRFWRGRTRRSPSGWAGLPRLCQGAHVLRAPGVRRNLGHAECLQSAPHPHCRTEWTRVGRGDVSLALLDS